LEALAQWPALLARIPDVVTWERPSWSPALRASVSGYFPSIDDLKPIALVTLLFSVIRPVVQYVILRKVGKKSGFDNDKCDKFAEAAFQVIYYAPIMLWGLSICYNAEWFWSFDFWNGRPNHVMSWEMRTFYMIQFGFYVHSILFLFAETRKKDFVAMLAHHLATSAVMALAYNVNYHRIGVAILMVHDPADVFLNLAKLFNYYGKQKATDNLFIVFTLIWMLTRLTLFPFMVKSAWGELWDRLQEPGLLPDTIICPPLLTVLLILHIYWFYLILLIVRKSLKSKGVQGDIREESSSPKAEKNAERKKKL